MNRIVYRYTFEPTARIADARDSLFLSAFAAECLHGRAQVLLDAVFRLDPDRRTCVIEGATPVGRTIAQVFTGLLIRAFGEDAFTVERVTEPPQAKP